MGYHNGEVDHFYSHQSGGFSVRCLNIETTTSQLNVTPANQDVIAPAGTTTFEVTSNISWTVDESVSWLSVLPLSGGGNGTITVTYEANNSPESRIGQITITADGGNPVVNVSVTQAGAPQFACGQAFTDERDGKNYNTVLIGTQCWFKENLNVGTMISGINYQANNGIIEKYCYNDTPSNCIIYGGLYQWDEMMNYNVTPGGKGICPTGWHLPTDAEWSTLTTYLGGESVAGGKMKDVGSYWYPPNTGATNSSGFTALPAGTHNSSPAFGDLGYTTDFWSSTENDSSNAWWRHLFYDTTDVYRYYNNKSPGWSVRCLNDN